MSINSIISQQLNDITSFFGNIQEEKDIPVPVLDTCGGLIELVSEILREVIMDKDATDSVFASTEYVSSCLTELAGVIKASPDIVPSTEILEKLSEEKAKAARFRTQIAKAKMDLPVITEENKKLSEEADRLTGELEEKKAIRDSLKDSLKNCSDDIFEEISKEIADVSTEIATKEQKKKQMEAERDSAKNELAKTVAALSELQKTIDTYTDEEKTAARAVKEHEEELRRLEEAKKLSTPEKVQELLNEKAKIQNEANRIEGEITQLKDAKDAIEHTVITHQQEKTSVETDIIAVILDKMAPLKDIMKTHTEELNEIKKEAEALKKSIADAKSLREKYAFMLDNNESSFNAMAQALGTEHKNLRETLDITKSGKISENITIAKKAIDEIESIIAVCANACTLDNDNTVKMATAMKK